MTAAGVQLLVYRPDIAPFNLRRSRLRRLHRKLAIVDARIALVGGINIIDDMHTPGQTPPRVDYAVSCEGRSSTTSTPRSTRLWVIVSWTQLQRRWRAWALRCAPNALAAHSARHS